MVVSNWLACTETAPFGVVRGKIIYDAHQAADDFLFLDLNPAFEVQTGIKAIELIDKRASVMDNGFGKALIRHMVDITTMGKSKEEVTFEWYGNKTGKWFLTQVYETGEATLTLVLTDITRLKEKELAFQKSEENLRTTLHSIGDAVITTDNKGVITGINPVASTLTGWEEEQAKGMKITEVLNMQNAQSGAIVDNPVSKVLRTGKVVAMANHTKLLSRSGTSYQISDSGAPIRDSEGNITGVVMVFRDVTDQYNMREALKDSEKKLELIFSSASDIIYLLGVEANQQFRFLSVNPPFLQATGLTEKEVVGKLIDEVIPPPSLSLVKKNYNKALKERRIVRWEETTVYPSGTKTGIVSIAPVINTDGSCHYMVGTVHDITELKQAERDLRENEIRFHELFEHMKSGVAVYVATEQGNDFLFKDINRAVEKIEGVKKVDVIGKSVKEVFPGVVQFGLFDKIKEVWRTGKPTHHPITRYTDNRIRGWRENYIYRLPTGEVVTVYDDVTKQKQAEEDLQNSEIRYHQLFEHMRNGVSIYQAVDNGNDFIISNINRAGKKIDKISATDVLGKSIKKVFPAVVDFGFFSALKEVYRTGIPKHLPGFFYKDDRIEGWRENYVYKLPTGEVISIYEDITQRKQDEEKIIRLNNELEEKVRKRTEELSHLNKELEAFTYTASHDLRSPVRQIKGFIDLLRKEMEDVLTDTAQQYIDTIEDRAEKMRLLIEKLLELSHAGRKKLDYVPIDTNLLIREVISELQETYKNTDTQWHVNNMPELSGDKTLLRIVFMNLMDNAVKFSQMKKKPEVFIRCKKKKEVYVFEIRDNGVGFDRDKAVAIFNPFTRLNSGQEFSGTGIGLATVARIIEKHGGETWASAERNKGASFFFTLPT